jgi:hypothetical protein
MTQETEEKGAGKCRHPAFPLGWRSHDPIPDGRGTLDWSRPLETRSRLRVKFLVIIRDSPKEELYVYVVTLKNGCEFVATCRVNGRHKKSPDKISPYDLFNKQQE